MNNRNCITLITAKNSVDRRDRLFLVRGEDEGDCLLRFRKFANDPAHKYEVDVDIRTTKFLGDGPNSTELSINNESGVVELDTTNNFGYSILVQKD